MNAEPPQRRLPIGPAIAAVGALLLIASLFIDWYEDITGFTVFEFVDLLLVLLALAAIASVAGGLRLVRPVVSPGALLAVAVLAVLVVGSQAVNDPPAVAGSVGPDKAAGIWLALAGSALMVAGALLGYARISLAVESRER